jgi:DNA-binding beta-propeller fold protein YncE
MRCRSRWCSLWILVLIWSANVWAAEAIQFKPTADFLKLPDGWKLGACSAVTLGGHGEIYLFHRGQHPILCFDAEGKFLRSFGEEVTTAHGLRVDPQGNLWATDIGSHRVFKFDPMGKVLLSLGTGQPGTGTDQFDRPTDVAFGPKGEFYVSDGYGNSRVLKFSPSGALLGTWGTPGTRGGEFNLPHSIVVDREGRVLVGDRENNRVQIFNSDGKLLEMWRGFAPYGLALDKEGTVYVADGRANQILRLSANGRVQQKWGRKGTKPGEYDMPHMLAVDPAGNVLVAEVNGQRLQKLVRQ